MRRLVALISVLMVLDTAAYAAVIPLIPHYRAELGLSPFGAGLLLAAYSAAVILFAVPSGRLSDVLGPKWMTTAGAATLVAGLGVMAVSHSFVLLLIARLFQGAADAIVWSAGMAWVSSASPAESRGGRIGVIQAAAGVGFIAGPAIGAVAISGVGIAPTFLAMSGLAAVLLVLVMVEPGAGEPPDARQSLAPVLAACFRQPLITASVIVIFVAAVVGGALQLLVTLQLADGGMSGSRIGAVYTVGAIVASAVAIATGRGGDRIGRIPLAIGGPAVVGVMVATLALPVSVGWFVALVILVFGLEAVLYAVGYPLSVDGADRSLLGHGVVLGVINLAWGIGAVIGPLAGSGLSDVAGSDGAYLLLAVFSLGACLVVRAKTAAIVVDPT
jgi:DHA1 family tetracycline resistance protein-like MFS transporter